MTNSCPTWERLCPGTDSSVAGSPAGGGPLAQGWGCQAGSPLLQTERLFNPSHWHHTPHFHSESSLSLGLHCSTLHPGTLPWVLSVLMHGHHSLACSVKFHPLVYCTLMSELCVMLHNTFHTYHSSWICNLCQFQYQVAKMTQSTVMQNEQKYKATSNRKQKIKREKENNNTITTKTISITTHHLKFALFFWSCFSLNLSFGVNLQFFYSFD